MRWAYTEATLPLHKAPNRSQLKDLQDANVYVQRRAATFSKCSIGGKPARSCRVAHVGMRIGESLSFPIWLVRWWWIIRCFSNGLQAVGPLVRRLCV